MIILRVLEDPNQDHLSPKQLLKPWRLSSGTEYVSLRIQDASIECIHPAMFVSLKHHGQRPFTSQSNLPGRREKPSQNEGF